MSGTSPRAQLGGSQRAAQGNFPGRAAKPPECWRGGGGSGRGPGAPPGECNFMGWGVREEPGFYLALTALRQALPKRAPRGCITASCPSASPRSKLEDLLPCSGKTKAPCSQGSPQSSGGPTPWPSLTTNGSAPMISNWVCEVGPLSSAPGAWTTVGGKDTKAQGPRVSLTEFVLEAPPAQPQGLPVRGQGRATLLSQSPEAGWGLPRPLTACHLSPRARPSSGLWLPWLDCPDVLLLPQPPFWKLRARRY